MPWWHRNYFAERIPAIHSFILSRAGWILVIGVGTITVLAGLTDLYGTFARRSKRESVRSAPSPEL